MKTPNVSLFSYFLLLVYMSLSLVGVKAFVPLVYKCKWNHQKKAVVGLITARHMAKRSTTNDQQNMSTNESDKNAKFFDELARAKKISEKAINILKENRIYEDELLQCDKNDLKTLSIDFIDAIRLYSWVQMKKEEGKKMKREEAERRENERHEEKEQRERKLREAQRKKILLFRPNSQNISPMIFSDSQEFSDHIYRRSLDGAIELKNGKVPDRLIPCDYDDLKHDEMYYFFRYNDIPDDLQENIDNAIRSRCDYASQQHLSNIFNCDFKIIGNDIVLKSSKGKRLRDVDSLFVSTDDSIFVLVERKKVVRTRGAARLFKKISDTANAFKECLADTGFCNNLQISPKASPTIYSMLYIQAGDDAVVEEALNRGIFVLTSNLELRCPPSFKKLS